MKKFVVISIVILLGIAMSNCSKEEQPRYVKMEILPRTGKKILQMEEYVDSHRDNISPGAYHELALYARDEVMKVLLDELKPDTILTNHGEIARVVGEYDKFWREKSPKYKSKVWGRLDVGVDIEVYRYLGDYSDDLLYMLKSYCEHTVNGSSQWVSGERINEEEEKIKNMFFQHPDEYFQWQYSDRLYNRFLKFAENPNNKPKYEKNGFLNFGWWQ